MADGADPSIEQILAEENLEEALCQNFPKLTNYVIKHFKEIVDIAIGNTEIETPEVLSTATAILMSPSNGIVDRFQSPNNQSLMQMVTDILIESSSECRALFRFITGLMVRTNGVVLSYIKDPVRFYKSVLAHVMNPAAREFLVTLFERRRKFAQVFAEKVEADVLTLALVYQGEASARVAMEIASRIVDISEEESKIVQRMSTPQTISFIISVALDAATVELSNASWIVVQSILEKNDKVKEVIAGHAEQIGRFIADCSPFTLDKRNAARVLFSSVTEALDVMYPLGHSLLKQIEQQLPTHHNP